MRIPTGFLLPLAFLLLFLHETQLVAVQEGPRRLRSEEAEDYYQKWLREDAVYIITDEERSVFEKLTTPEEKEQFIEQFWFRRDPDPRTAENEFKLEHYRRIAYANERFGSGSQGWRSDRGKIYIIHGPPVQVESHASGETYHRPMTEGGGSTSVFPFEVWRYRHIDGVGDDIVLEFVDSTLSGNYQLAMSPEEKDALFYSPGLGPTRLEELGINYPLMESMRNDLFYRYKTFAKVTSPLEVKYKDLKQLVEVNLQFDSLPFQLRADYFSLSADQVLVPVTVQVDNRNLTFKPENDRHVARVAVYGIVSDLGNRLITEFEHDLITSCSPNQLVKALQKRSSYQKILLLERKQRFKLDLVVKDLNSGKVGVGRHAILPPRHESEQLAASSLILSDFIQILGDMPDKEEMFVLGDVRVLPSLSKTFHPGQALGLYLQIYNAGIDQKTMTPSLKVVCRLLKGDEVLKEVTDPDGRSIQYYSDQRVVLLQRFSLDGLESGDYRVAVGVEDQLSGQSLKLSEKFKIQAVPAGL